MSTISITHNFSLPGLNIAYALASAVLAATSIAPEITELATATLDNLDSLLKDQEAYAPELAQARQSYCDDDTSIDDQPIFSAGDDGVWVSAWVWVPFDEDRIAALEAAEESEA